jgi:TRAP-type C4-dicarboxylate transport system substrate-binding protein
MSNKEIRSVADFRATKICLLPADGITQSLFKKLGVKGVSLAVPDVENALTTGGLDACYGSLPTALALNWDAKIKYVTSLSLGHAISATVIRQEPFNKMSADDQALVSKHLIASAAKQRSIVRGEATGARGKLQAAGVIFAQSPPGFSTEFDKAARAVETELTGKLFNKTDLDLALKYRAEYRAKIAGK